MHDLAQSDGSEIIDAILTASLNFGEKAPILSSA